VFTVDAQQVTAVYALPFTTSTGNHFTYDPWSWAMSPSYAGFLVFSDLFMSYNRVMINTKKITSPQLASRHLIVSLVDGN
jgi:hypothetical protein